MPCTSCLRDVRVRRRVRRRRMSKEAPCADRDREVSKTLVVVLVLNVVVAVTKLVVGWWAGSLALVSDSLHAGLDASSNVVGLIGIALARRPPDEGHPYGHRRFETIAAVVIGLFILAGLLGIVNALINAVVEQRPAPRPTFAAASMVAATVVMGVAVSRYERRRGTELDSSILVADAAHTMSDTLGSLVVLASFGGIALGLRWADVGAAAIVSLLIGRTAWSVLSSNVSVLADAVQLDPADVQRVVLAIDGVRGAHKIRSRGAPDHIQLDLHIQLEPRLPLVDAHAKTHEVASRLRAAFPTVRDVLIHTEPAEPDSD
jgi:cation diffusion facilitator family transporter